MPALCSWPFSPLPPPQKIVRWAETYMRGFFVRAYFFFPFKEIRGYGTTIPRPADNRWVYGFLLLKIVDTQTVKMTSGKPPILFSKIGIG